MDLTEFEFVMRDVPRLGTKRHAQILFGLVRWLRPTVCVEVGSWTGYTACWIGRALQENDEGLLWAIDDFSLEPDRHIKENLAANIERAGLERRIGIIDGRSRDVEWPEHVDFAYIDGDHSYDGCRADFDRAAERGASCIVVHDTVSWWGPRRLVEQLRVEGEWDVIEAGFDEGLAVFMRRPEKPAEDFSQAEYPRGEI